MSTSPSKPRGRHVATTFLILWLRSKREVVQAYKTSWGLKCPGVMRGRLLSKLADLLEENMNEFNALESLNVGEWSAQVNSHK